MCLSGREVGHLTHGSALSQKHSMAMADNPGEGESSWRDSGEGRHQHPAEDRHGPAPTPGQPRTERDKGYENI